MAIREDGWYWVKRGLSKEWECAFWNFDEWCVAGCDEPIDASDVYATGPRIPEPDDSSLNR